MRRKDKQMPPELFEENIKKCEVIRLALHDDPAPYIVPLNFGYQLIDETFYIYMHCANEGKKLDLLKQNPNVGFELETDVKLLLKDKAAQCTTQYKSIIGTGLVEEVMDYTEKVHGLNVLMEQFTAKYNNEYPEKLIHGVTVLKLTVTSIDGKTSNS